MFFVLFYIFYAVSVLFRKPMLAKRMTTSCCSVLLVWCDGVKHNGDAPAGVRQNHSYVARTLLYAIQTPLSVQKRSWHGVENAMIADGGIASDLLGRHENRGNIHRQFHRARRAFLQESAESFPHV